MRNLNSAALIALLLMAGPALAAPADDKEGPKAEKTDRSDARSVDAAQDNLATEQRMLAEPPVEVAAQGRDFDATIDEFRNAYGRAGQPRIAIYMNRKLASDTSEFRTEERVVVSGRGKDEQTGFEAKSSTGNAQMEVSKQTHAGDTGKRAGPEEEWMWDFEEGFTNAFLDADATLVDRATILRLSGAEDEKARADGSHSDARTVEMGALTKFAEVFVEITMIPSESSTGWKVRAVAKEIKTGKVLAQARADAQISEVNKDGKKEFESGPNGYVKKTFADTPVDQGETLAFNLMDAVAKNWRKR
jgi:hypothetical protein